MDAAIELDGAEQVSNKFSNSPRIERTEVIHSATYETHTPIEGGSVTGSVVATWHMVSKQTSHPFDPFETNR